MLRDALVVGVNSYANLPGLQAPAHDAEAIADLLQTHGEFRVHRLPEVLHNGTPQVGKKTPVRVQDLESALVNLFKPKGSNVPHTALFYFSGHGIQREAGISDGYLALSDSNPAAGFYGLSLFWLRRLLQESPVRQRILILDCCHSGELLNFLDADPGARMGTDRLFMAASREYETAYESINGPYSVFTNALQAALDPRRSETGIVTSYSLTNAVSQALKQEIQQPLFESSGSEIILTRCATGESKPVVSSADVCPYQGLASFEENHADWFFGRETQIKKMLESLRQSNFIAVLGASGVGKSSIVKAGLLPEVRRGALQEGSDRWPIKVMTPTDHPLKSLASVFLEPHLGGIERAEQLERVESFLHNGNAGLAQLVRASLPVETQITTRSTEHPRLLLVIDQFEELLTLGRGEAAEHERRQFLNCLVRSLQLVPDLLSVVIVLRSDAQTPFNRYEELTHLIEQHQVLVPTLTYEQIKSVITRPAQKAGLTCDPNLVYTLLLDVIGAPGELPLLQYTLTRLWEQRDIDPLTLSARLTLDAYTRMGGIRGALQMQANEVFHRLSPDEQYIAKRIFLALTHLGEGTEDTRRRVLKSELVTSQCPLEQVDRVLEKLVQAKLVVVDQRPQRHADRLDANSKSALQSAGLFDKMADFDQSAWEFGVPLTADPSAETAVTVDIAHEALIRGWPLLRSWLDENRERLRQQRRIEQIAQDWYRAGEPHSSEYLLSGGRLHHVECLFGPHTDELSDLARRFIEISQREKRRASRESRLLQVSIPSVLLLALAFTFTQYRSAIALKAAQSQQIKLMMAREKTATAQTLLKEPGSDPTTALLLSRLAVERDTPTQEGQQMLRSALQMLRLQQALTGHSDTIRSIAFSAASSYMATASDDGTVQILQLKPQMIATEPLALMHTLQWKSEQPTSDESELKALVLSPQGDKLAALVQGASQVKVWDVKTGNQSFLLTSAQPIEQVVFSPDGKWVISGSDRNLSVWGAETGQLLSQTTLSGNLSQLQFIDGRPQVMTAEENGTLSIWEINDTSSLKPQLKLVRTIQHPTSLRSVSVSPKGRWILTVGGDDQLRLWDTVTGALQKTYAPHAQPVLASVKQAAKQTDNTRPAQAQSPATLQVMFSPDEQRVAVLNEAAQLRMWNVGTGQIWLKSLTETPSRLRTAPLMSFSPDGQWLAIAGQTADSSALNPVLLLESQTGREEAILRGHQYPISAVQFSVDGNYVATGDQGGQVRLWATQSNGEFPTLRASQTSIRWLRFYQPTLSATHMAQDEATSEQPSERLGQFSAQPLFAMAHFNRLSKWRKLLQFGASSATTGSFSPSVPLDLLTVDAAGRLNQWTIDSNGSNWPEINESVASFTAITRSSSAQMQFSLAKISPTNHQPVETAQDFASPSIAVGDESLPTSIAALDISLDGQYMAIASASGSLEIRQRQADQSFSTLYQFDRASTETKEIRQLLFDASGEHLLSVGADQSLRLWNVNTRQFERTFEGHQAAIQMAQFSPDSQQLVTASLDGTARLWSVATGEMLHTFELSSPVNAANFSPDGKQIVTASANGSVIVFDVAIGEKRYALSGHEGAVVDARFSPDGQLIATAGADGIVHLWETRTGQEQSQLNPTGGQKNSAIQQIFFSPDSQYVVTVTNDGTIQLWAATWEKLLKLARDRTLRQLTAEECSRYLQASTTGCPTLEVPTTYSLQR